MFLSVINFSEGGDNRLYESLAATITKAGGCVLHYSLDADHNRGVLGFYAEEDAFPECVVAAAKIAVASIDLTRHHGQHPRFGAVDVIPVIPVNGSTMQESIILSKSVGAKLADELSLPVFLYENSAMSPLREDLATVRRLGQGKVALADDALPDYGPQRFHPTAGAVAVGARGPLVAYNINLSTDNVILAKTIAASIREARKHGELPGVKAIGLYLESKGIAQISTNVTLPDDCPPVKVWQYVQKLLPDDMKQGAESELIGIASRKHIPIADETQMRFSAIDNNQWLETSGLSY